MIKMLIVISGVTLGLHFAHPVPLVVLVTVFGFIGMASLMVAESIRWVSTPKSPAAGEG
jgi:hypothetical protein